MTNNAAFQRLALLTGREALAALGRASVLVFGAGGVGSWCAEALARSGVGRIGIIDPDTVCVTNINRQVQATAQTIGEPKAAGLKARLLAINPSCEINAWNTAFSRGNAGLFGIENADYVIDAIDSLSHKLDLIETVSGEGFSAKRPVLFSSMGAALKLDPCRLKTGDIWETSGCPLARLVRAGLRKRGFTGNFTVVYSDEKIPRREEADDPSGRECVMCSPGTAAGDAEDIPAARRSVNGSAVTVTASAGMILASLVIRDICAKTDGVKHDDAKSGGAKTGGAAGDS